MKSKKLLLIASSFFVIGTLASCGGKSENEELKAEFKEEKMYNIGDTISKDDLLVTYTKGNSVKELKNEEFNVEGFNTEGKYTFEYDPKIEPSDRAKTFNVTYNKLKATASTKLFNGRVTAEEFYHAIDYIRYYSPNRDFTCDVSYTEKVSEGGSTETSIENRNNVYVKGTLIKANLYSKWKDKKEEERVEFEDYNPEFKYYFKYDGDGKFENIWRDSHLEEKFLEFYYFDYLKVWFDEKECFNETTRDYVFGFDFEVPEGETTEKMSVKLNVGFDSNFRITYLNDITTEEVKKGDVDVSVELKANRTFKYGETGEIEFPGKKEPVYKVSGDSEGRIYQHNAEECGEDNNALFSIKFTKDLSEESGAFHQLYLLKDDGGFYTRDDIEKLENDIIVICYCDGNDFSPDLDDTGNYFMIPTKELAGKKQFIINVYFRGGKDHKVGIKFMPSLKDSK